MASYDYYTDGAGNYEHYDKKTIPMPPPSSSGEPQPGVHFNRVGHEFAEEHFSSLNTAKRWKLGYCNMCEGNNLYRGIPEHVKECYERAYGTDVNPKVPTKRIVFRNKSKLPNALTFLELALDVSMKDLGFESKHNTCVIFGPYSSGSTDYVACGCSSKVALLNFEQEHLPLHTRAGGQPFACPPCKTTFPTWMDRDVHIRGRHGHDYTAAHLSADRVPLRRSDLSLYQVLQHTVTTFTHSSQRPRPYSNWMYLETKRLPDPDTHFELWENLIEEYHSGMYQDIPGIPRKNVTGSSSSSTRNSNNVGSSSSSSTRNSNNVVGSSSSSSTRNSKSQPTQRPRRSIPGFDSDEAMEEGELASDTVSGSSSTRKPKTRKSGTRSTRRSRRSRRSASDVDSDQLMEGDDDAVSDSAGTNEPGSDFDSDALQPDDELMVSTTRNILGAELESFGRGRRRLAREHVQEDNSSSAIEQYRRTRTSGGRPAPTFAGSDENWNW